MDWNTYRVEVAQRWRTEHNLPRLSDALAVLLYWGHNGQYVTYQQALRLIQEQDTPHDRSRKDD